VFLPTSRHANLSDMKRLAEALSPRVLIPIHSYHGELFSNFFETVRRLDDGDIIEV